MGWSLDQIKDGSVEQIISGIRKIAQEKDAAHIHVWSREWLDHKKDSTSQSELEVELMIAALNKAKTNWPVNQETKPDERVADLIRIDSGHWWLGWHIAGSIAQRWPAGVPPLRIPDSMVSRAYLKTSESLLWSGISPSNRDTCIEIGSAPGGSCQRLLESGAKVIAVDPADLDPVIAGNRRVTHLKMRGHQVPYRSLSGVSWLLADSNVAPKHTLDTVEAMVGAKNTRFRGLLLTLKFSKIDQADELPAYVQRVNSWGFQFVKTRQLAYGRQEVCLMGLKQKSVRRFRG